MKGKSSLPSLSPPGIFLACDEGEETNTVLGRRSLLLLSLAGLCSSWATWLFNPFNT